MSRGALASEFLNNYMSTLDTFIVLIVSHGRSRRGSPLSCSSWSVKRTNPKDEAAGIRIYEVYNIPVVPRGVPIR